MTKDYSATEEKELAIYKYLIPRLLICVLVVFPLGIIGLLWKFLKEFYEDIKQMIIYILTGKNE